MVNVRIGGREADPRSVDRGNFTPEIHEWVTSSKKKCALASYGSIDNVYI